MSQWLKKARVQLEKNPNIQSITEKNVNYAAAFKKRAVLDYEKGVSPKEIFQNHGFDPSLFPADYFRDCVKRWRRSAKQRGLKILEQDRRGKGSTGRPVGKSKKDLSESQLRARVAYLEAEVDFLKKLRALAKQEK